MSKDISGKIIDKIKEEKINPKPHVFDYRSFLFWFVFSFLIILGGIAFSLILISIFSFGQDAFRYASGGFLRIFLMSIPYLWIILFGLFAYFGLRAFRSTKRGYRQNFALILLIIFLASFSLGSILHILGFGKKMHQSMVERVPFYEKLSPTKEVQWSKPEKGMLGGQIVKVGKDFFVVQDFRSRKIMVIYSEESVIGRNVKLRKGERVRVAGERIDERTFQAKFIRPWEGNGEFRPEDRKRLKEFRERSK